MPTQAKTSFTVKAKEWPTTSPRLKPGAVRFVGDSTQTKAMKPKPKPKPSSYWLY